MHIDKCPLYFDDMTKKRHFSIVKIFFCLPFPNLIPIRKQFDDEWSKKELMQIFTREDRNNYQFDNRDTVIRCEIVFTWWFCWRCWQLRLHQQMDARKWNKQMHFTSKTVRNNKHHSNMPTKYYLPTNAFVSKNSIFHSNGKWRRDKDICFHKSNRSRAFHLQLFRTCSLAIATGSRFII